MSKLVYVAIACLGLATVAGVEVTVPDESSKLYAIPKANEIARLEAESYGIKEFLDQRFPRLKTFVVPRKRYESILRFFKKPTVDRKPKLALPEMGSIKITTKTGEVFRIPFYWGQSTQPLVFSVRGVRCLDGRSCRKDVDAGLALDSVIREIYERKTGHIVTKPISGSR